MPIQQMFLGLGGAVYTTDLAVAHGNSPYITVYKWGASGFGPKYSDPSTLPPADGKEVDFSPDGTAIAIGHNNSPYISVYPWDSGFGTKFSDPSTLPTGTCDDVAFRPTS